ncbi:hypothetical protein EV680_12317 [Uruburuella suis]|uniref:tRNA (Uracil-5-)-methyltransferase n=1 Tax=Uruburuella suis TaxID=252130 RepID=A0ABY2BXA1_9NEIS|nr:hypothetical protein EV680_12317 [Uruburuella suis]
MWGFRRPICLKRTQVRLRRGAWDKMLLDPPLSGAYAVVQMLHKPYLPQRVVYVPCNPATFARDAAVWVEKSHGFVAAVS